MTIPDANIIISVSFFELFGSLKGRDIEIKIAGVPARTIPASKTRDHPDLIDRSANEQFATEIVLYGVIRSPGFKIVLY